MADRPDAGTPQWTSDRFEAWLEQTAKNEDHSKQEVLHRMMASFWVLTEFEDLVQGDSNADFPNLEQALDGAMLDDHASTTDTHQETPPPSTESTDAETVRGLVEGFATYLDDHGPTTDATPDHASGPEPAQADPTGADLTDLEDRTDDIAARQDDLEAEHESLAERHGELAERVDTDMAKVEQILKRLTQKYQESGATLDQLETTLTSVLEDRRTQTREQDQLTRLLQAAHAHGIESGACQDCDTEIRLGLLTSPRCPHCSKTLVDVRPGGWFKSDTIITADARQQHTPAAPRHQADQPHARRGTQRQQHATDTDVEETDLAEALDMSAPDDPASDTEDDRESFEWTEW